MSVGHKLESLNDRRQDLERELAGLAEVKGGSTNTALPDLEQALLGELGQIEVQIGQLRAYLTACEEGGLIK